MKAIKFICVIVFGYMYVFSLPLFIIGLILLFGDGSSSASPSSITCVYPSAHSSSPVCGELVR